MENNTQNKAKFFAQYLGQDVLMGYSSPVNFEQYCTLTLQDFHLSANYLNDDSILKPKLVLKNIYDISIADSEICFIDNFHYSYEFLGLNIHRGEKITFKYGGKSCNKFGTQNHLFFSENIGYQCSLKTFDYLRSKGYALPFMELLVSELVSFGWVCLR